MVLTFALGLFFVAFARECCYSIRHRSEREHVQTMSRQLMKLLRRVRTRSGATLFECAAIMFLIGIVAVLILQGIGNKTNNMLTPVNDGFKQ